MSIWITELGPGSLAVKDLFDTAGVRTTYGSPIFADHVPHATAEAVARLERLHDGRQGEPARVRWGITSENVTFGTVPNPIAPGRIAGGSSGGCGAALAAGLVDYALGTDSGGSIRIPAACCGVVGFKPSYGLVPLDGCFPLTPSFDHAGPMARDVEGCERMMEALVPGFSSRRAFAGRSADRRGVDRARRPRGAGARWRRSQAASSASRCRGRTASTRPSRARSSRSTPSCTRPTATATTPASRPRWTARGR